jgi:hypothetical protein
MEKGSVTNILKFLSYHLCLRCGEYLVDPLDLDSWLWTNEKYLDFKHKKA